MNWISLLNNGRFRPSTRHKDTDPRNDFESDFGRTIFSAAVRRMHDKTQVFPLSGDDNTHTRLTHSMEVMAIGHSLGIRIIEDKEFVKRVGKSEDALYREIPIILKNACLLHDIGNPPFGHFGETVIQNYFKKFFNNNSQLKVSDLEIEDFTNFDGNAQGFRILSKLQTLNDEYGLNLTYATLSAYLKYPNADKIDKTQIATSKRGVFQSERRYLNDLSHECGTVIKGNFVRNPLSYLMEAADTICYLVMDIEDGFNKGWYDFSFIEKKLSHISDIPGAIKEIEKRKNGYGEEITMMVNFRIYLIDRLVKLAVKNFLTNIDLIEVGKYKQELVYDDLTKLADGLKSFCILHIFPKRDITSLELTGHSVLSGLLNYYTDFIFHKDKNYKKRAQGLLSRSILRTAFIENKLPESAVIDDLNDYYKLRVIVDYISGMTDQFALSHYQKLSGQKIN
jgi:dGTPase